MKWLAWEEEEEGAGWAHLLYLPDIALQEKCGETALAVDGGTSLGYIGTVCKKPFLLVVGLS